MTDAVLQTIRLMDGDGDGDGDGGSVANQTTTVPIAGETEGPDLDDGSTFGTVLLVALVVAAVLAFWHTCKRWQLRRERQMLQIQSSRADAVLGDMQMVPADDEYDDDDPELL